VFAAALLALASLWFAADSPSALGRQSQPDPVAGVDYVDGRVLVKFRPGAGASAQAAAHRAANGHVARVIPGIGVSVVEVGQGRTLQAIEAYTRNPNVLFAEVDGIAQAAVDCGSDAVPGSADPCFSRQWGLDNTGHDYGGGFAPGTADADVDAPEGWGVAAGGGVIVAVLDTGFDSGHPDLPGPEDSEDFTSTNIQDGNGHGTWTASIATGPRNNGIGIAGVAPDARLIVGKVLNDDGAGAWSWIAAGITWAAGYEPGTPTVISMSLGGRCRGGGPFGCQTLEAAVNAAASNANVLIVAAAGNAGGATEYPGAYPSVLAVAATDADDNIASFSSVGEVAAPGVNVFGAFPNCATGTPFTLGGSPNFKQCDYDYGSGTSASTPIVAGVAAIVWSAAPGRTALEVRAALEDSAQDIPGTNYDGAGRVSAECALAEAAGDPPPVACPAGGEPAPTPTPTSTPTPTPDPGDGSLVGSSTNNGKTWTARVTDTSGSDLTGTWDYPVAGTAAVCVANVCELSGIPKKVGSVTFTPASGDPVVVFKP
jgi:thermitase